MILPKRNKISKSKNINFKTKYKQNNIYKPIGFWYSCRNYWYDWVISEDMTHFLHKYIIQVNIKNNITTNIHNKDPNKLLVIRSLKDFDLFTNTYKIKISDNINWIKVSKDFGGIEICPYLEKRRHAHWYYGWDVASGCIWNTDSIIKNIKLIYEKNKDNEYVKI